MNFQNMMKQAQALQKKMADMQQQLEKVDVVGSAAGGLVTCVATAKGEIKKFSIDSSLLDPEEKEMLEDLLVAVCTDAKRKADEAVSSMMGDMGVSPEMLKMMQ